MAANAGIRSCHGTLVGATADTVTLSGGGGKSAEIVNHGAGTIYYRSDGVTAVSLADETDVVLASQRQEIWLPASGVVSLISAGTPTYSVIVTG